MAGASAGAGRRRGGRARAAGLDAQGVERRVRLGVVLVVDQGGGREPVGVAAVGGGGPALQIRLDLERRRRRRLEGRLAGGRRGQRGELLQRLTVKGGGLVEEGGPRRQRGG